MTGLFWCVSLALSDMAFLVRWRPALRWETLPKGPMQFILAALLEHWDTYHQLLDWPSFLGYLDAVVEDEDLHEEYRQTYVDLTNAYSITESSLPVAWEAAEKWLQEYHIGMALDRARAALVAGDRASVFEELLGLREVAGTEPPSLPINLDDAALGDLLRQRPDESTAVPTGISRVDELWEGGLYPNNLAIVAADTNVGKALPVEMPIPTPEGWTTIGKIRAGDEVFDEQGKPCLVQATSATWNERPCYDVHFTDGTVVRADASHEWEVWYPSGGRYHPRIVETSELAQQTHKRRYVTVAGSLQLPPQKLSLDPYILGVWLGDGTAREGQITTADEEIVRALELAGFQPRLLGRYRVGTRGLGGRLRKLGLLRNKHIPEIYLRGSQEQRLALLQGLMDTDGTINPHTGGCEISQKSERLAENIGELLSSLGIRYRRRLGPSTLWGRVVGEQHRIWFQPVLPVFRLSRKAAHLRPASVRQLHRQIKKVCPALPQSTRCIMVSSPSHLFLAGPNMVPTHNSMMLCFLAASAYRANRRVLYFTYELTKAQVVERILTGLFGCAKQELNPDTVVDRLLDIRRRSNLTTASLVIDDGEGIQTVTDLKARLEREDVDLVLLDSADDLNPRRRYSKEYEAYKEIYTDIRLDICQAMGLPVLTSVQMNRDAVEKARTSLKHIADAFAKVQRAHLVLGMSQTVDEREHFLGPFVKLVILKDTEHGSRGMWDRYRTMFGRGSNGWPGFEYWPGKGDLD